jgi:pimeloyl-ACP methyl ester carboxylesterase
VWGIPSGLARDAVLDAGPPDGGCRQCPTALGVQGRSALAVVLVHGFAGSSASWFAVRRAPRADGRTVVQFDYAPWAASVDAMADRLVDAIEDVLAATGGSKVHLVGHSLGGVIIALALMRDRLAGQVDLVVTLGSPFSGSPWAGVLPLCPLVRALRDRDPRSCAGSPPLRPRTGSGGWHSPRRSMRSSPRTAPSPRIGRPYVSWSTHGRLMVDEAGHCGMLLDPDVIARIVAGHRAPRGRRGPRRSARRVS